jgi:hypothetical protein
VKREEIWFFVYMSPLNQRVDKPLCSHDLDVGIAIDFQNADISLWAKSFGVTISSRVNARTTHLVAGRYGSSSTCLH